MRFLALGLLATVIVLVPRSAVGQRREPKKPRLRTDVSVELITDQNGAALPAQRWARIFARFQVRLRVRRAIGAERISVTEQNSRSLRRVLVIGRLERNGRILVPGKTFTAANATALGKWLEGLKTYGAQGNPDGQPAFGLSAVQFDLLFEDLAQPVKTELAGKSVAEAIAALRLPASLPLRFTRTGTLPAGKVAPRTIGQGLSRGTTLAALLQAQGLAFRPRRSRAGKVELVVDRIQPAVRSWPLGWPLRLSRLKTARSLFKIVPVNLEDTPLLDVLDAIAIKTKVPILIDHHALAAKRIQPGKLTCTFPNKQTSWFALQKSLTNPHHLTRELRIDEAGHPLILISTIRPKPARRD